MSWAIVPVAAAFMFVGWIIGVIAGGMNERKAARKAVDLHLSTGSINRLGIIRVRELILASIEHRPIAFVKKGDG